MAHHLLPADRQSYLGLEVRLYEGQHTFDVIYGLVTSLGSANDSELTVGVQKDSILYTTVGCDSTGGMAPREHRPEVHIHPAFLRTGTPIHPQIPLYPPLTRRSLLRIPLPPTNTPVPPTNTLVPPTNTSVLRRVLRFPPHPYTRSSYAYGSSKCHYTHVPSVHRSRIHITAAHQHISSTDHYSDQSSDLQQTRLRQPPVTCSSHPFAGSVTGTPVAATNTPVLPQTRPCPVLQRPAHSPSLTCRRAALSTHSFAAWPAWA